MRSLMRQAALLCATALTLTACADEQSSAPTSPAVPRPSFALSSFPTTCDPKTLKSPAGDYAASSKDALLTVIGSMQTEYNKNGKGATLTNLAFDGLERLAAMRGSSALQKSGAAAKAGFDAVVKGFVGCMEDYITSSVAGRQEDFSTALGDGWMFEVRNATSAASDAAYEKGSSPYWSASANWGTMIAVAAPATTTATKRILIYGYDLSAYPYLLKDDKVAGNGFEIRTIPTKPTLSFGSNVTVGLCNIDAPTQGTFDTYRAEHKDNLLLKLSPQCARAGTFTPMASNMSFDAGSVFAVAKRAVDFFAPQPLHAATMFFVGSVGGAVSELSPSVIVNLQSVSMTFVSQPVNGYVNSPLGGNPGPSVRVQVTSFKGTPFPNVTVTIKVANNSGTNVAASGYTATTGSDGIATFPNLQVNKAGGYTLTASGAYDGLSGSVISNLFNVQNKAAP